MPTAPKRHGHTNNGIKAARQMQRPSPQRRGYTERWNQYGRELTREVIFCELCATVGRETDITRGPRHNSGGKIRGAVDHTVPVDGPDDPLFWERWNHRCLCVPCHNWKTNRFDGGHGHTPRPAARSEAGAMARWDEVVREYGGRSESS